MKALYTILLLISLSSLNAQNLVLNPSFETIINCPMWTGAFWSPNPANQCIVDWRDLGASADLYNACGRDNFKPRTGVGYAGILIYDGAVREYAVGQFSSPLDAGECYYVEFYVALRPGSKNSTDDIHAYISDDTFFNNNNVWPAPFPLVATPQIVNTGIIYDTTQYTRVSGIYTANGGETRISIGNFNDNANTTKVYPPWITWSGTPVSPAYYYLDDVSVTKLDIGPDVSLCAGDSALIVPNILEPSLNYSWSNGTTDTTTHVFTQGQLSLSISDGSSSCSLKDTLEVLSSGFNIVANPSMCLGQNYTLPSGTVVSTSGTYIDTVVVPGGCDSIFTTNLTVSSSFSSNVAIDLCAGETYALLSGAIVTTAGVYSDTISSGGGCDSVITSTITVAPPIVGNQNVTLCYGETLTLPGGQVVTLPGSYVDTLSSSIGCDSVVTTLVTVSPLLSGNENVTLCSGQVHVLPGGQVVSSSGIYTDTIPSVSGCDSVVTTMINVVPTITTNLNVELCLGEQHTLNGGVVATSEGDYREVYVGANGCDSTIITTVTFFPPSNIVISDNVSINLGESAHLNVDQVTGSPNWNPSTGLDCDTCLEVVSTPQETVTYTVTVNDEFGCPVTEYVRVEVLNNKAVYVPNSFTPDGDGRNDVFMIIGEDIESASLNIFNRWGELLFGTENKTSGWDGTYKGELVPGGVYVYSVEVVFADGSRELMTGSLNILR